MEIASFEHSSKMYSIFAFMRIVGDYARTTSIHKAQ